MAFSFSKKIILPKLNVQNMTIAVSLLVSICALGTSLMQAFIMKDQFKVMVEQQKLMVEQYKASTWARVELGANIMVGEQNAIQLFVRNAGTGPALIEAIRITYNGKPYARWHEIFKVLNIKNYTSMSSYQLRQKTLIAGENISFFKTNDTNLVLAIVGNMDKFKIEVCYKSVYGAVFLHAGSNKNNSYELDTKEVKSNPILPKEEFLE
jgi:hypothetical protein